MKRPTRRVPIFYVRPGRMPLILRSPTGRKPIFLGRPTQRVPLFLKRSTGRVPLFLNRPTGRVPLFLKRPTGRVPLFYVRPASGIPLLQRSAYHHLKTLQGSAIGGSYLRPAAWFPPRSGLWWLLAVSVYRPLAPASLAQCCLLAAPVRQGPRALAPVLSQQLAGGGCRQEEAGLSPGAGRPTGAHPQHGVAGRRALPSPAAVLPGRRGVGQVREEVWVPGLVPLTAAGPRGVPALRAEDGGDPDEHHPGPLEACLARRQEGRQEGWQGCAPEHHGAATGARHTDGEKLGKPVNTGVSPCEGAPRSPVARCREGGRVNRPASGRAASAWEFPETHIRLTVWLWITYFGHQNVLLSTGVKLIEQSLKGPSI